MIYNFRLCCYSFSAGKKSPPKVGLAADSLVPDINDEFMS